MRGADHHAARDAGISPSADRARSRRADDVLQGRRRRPADSKLGVRARAAGDARQSVLRVPLRDRAGECRRRATITRSATSISRRASRSSSGAGFRTSSCSASPSGISCRSPRRSSAQVQRMLKDPRSEALTTRFASQWLRLQDLDKVHPDAFFFPDYDQQLADAMRTETRDVLQRHREERSQRARTAHRRLHVRERAAREALWHSERLPAPSSASYISR